MREKDLHDPVAYRRAYEAYAQEKAGRYARVKFDPSHADGIQNFVREQALLGQLAPRPGERILDCGCAAGRQTHLSARRGAFAVGVDIARPFVIEAGRTRVEGASFLVADIEALPFRPRSFDKVMCGEVLEHVRSLDRALNEVHGLLKPSGTLVVSVPQDDHHKTIGYRLARLAAALLPGFSSSSLEADDSPYHLRQFDLRSLTLALGRHRFRLRRASACVFLAGPGVFKLVDVLSNRLKVFARLLIRLEERLSRIEPLHGWAGTVVASFEKSD